MRVSWETKYAELMKKLRDECSKEKPRCHEKAKKPSVNLGHHYVLKKIRESRDYSFLFSDDNVEPNPIPRNSTSSNNVAADEPREVSKPLSSLKIKIRYKEIPPKNGEKEKDVGSKINLERKEIKRQPLRRQISEDKYDKEEAEKAIREIRRMYNTERFVGRDDGDRDMETSHEEMLKEERKSSKIGRKEDREQMRLIMEEERREKSKKRKISS